MSKEETYINFYTSGSIAVAAIKIVGNLLSISELAALYKAAANANRRIYGRVKVETVEDVSRLDEQVIGVVVEELDVNRQAMQRLLSDLMPTGRKYVTSWMTNPRDARALYILGLYVKYFGT